MGITYQGMASNWTQLSLGNLLWLYSLAEPGMAALPLFHGHVARFLAGPRLEATLWLGKEEKRDLGGFFHKRNRARVFVSASAYSGFGVVCTCSLQRDVRDSPPLPAPDPL